jgi:hypothetical protein
LPQAWANAWQAAHPEWTCKVWREADLRSLKMVNRRLFDALLKAGTWHGAADVARLEILYQLGGVYVDIDSRPLTPLTGAPFMSADVFAGYEPVPSMPGRVANGTIGAVPGSEAIRTAIDLVHKMRVTDPPWSTIGAPALTAALLVHRACCDVQVLPAHTFYRNDARGRQVMGRGTSYSEHFWAGTKKGYPNRTVVLVPRRAGIPERDRIWHWCRDIWQQQGWPIYEGHDDGEGLFNASLARNRAAAAADADGVWDVAIFADADTVPWDWRPVRQAVDLAARTDRFVRPFQTYFVLDEDATEAFMATGLRPRKGTRPLGQHVYGGIHVVSRTLWDESGGYDERFVGWGGEDTSYQFACQTLRGYRRLTGEVFHLYHPMQRRDPSKPEFIANRALEKRYVDASKNREKMLALLAEPRRL